MKCKNCNVLIPEESSSCPSCGKSLMELASEGLIENMDVKQDTISEETFTMTYEEGNHVETFDNSALESVETLEHPEEKNIGTFQNNNQVVEGQVTGATSKEEVSTSELGSIETFDLGNNASKVKKKKSIVPLIGVLAAIVLFLGAGFLVYLKFKPKLAFKSVIDQSLKQFEKSIGFDYDTMKMNFDVALNVSGKEDEAELLSMINKLGLSGVVENDYKNNKSFVKLNTTYDKEELLYADVFFDKNEAFIKLNNLYDKYIKYDFEGLELEKPLTEDYNVITETVVKELEKNLKLEYFKKSNNGEYAKYTLELTNKQADEVARNIVTDLKDEDKFMTSLANVTKEDKDELVKSFEELLKEEDDMSDADKVAFTISLYADKKTNEVKRIEVDEEKDKIEIEIENENSVLFKITTENETLSYRITTSKDGDKDKLVLSISYGDYSIEVILTYSVKYNEKITEPDVSRSVDYNSLTEEDSNKILENLMKNNGVSKILEETGLSSLFTGTLGYGDYEYGYDDDSLYDDNFGLTGSPEIFS